MTRSVRERQEQKQTLGIYLLPIVGAIPAIWTLYRDRGGRQARNASRLAINLLIGWIISSVLLSYGARGASEILAFRLLYLHTLVTSGYFLTCTFLIWHLRKGSLPHLPKSK